MELKADSNLRNLFQDKSPLEFLKLPPRDVYLELGKLAQQIFSLFGSTYIFEHTFSMMKNETPERSRLEDVLRLKITN